TGDSIRRWAAKKSDHFHPHYQFAGAANWKRPSDVGKGDARSIHLYNAEGPSQLSVYATIGQGDAAGGTSFHHSRRRGVETHSRVVKNHEGRKPIGLRE